MTPDLVDLTSWLYISRSLLSPSTVDEELLHIVTHSRARNRKLKTTGMLLFTGTRFVQEIEGPEDAIAEIRARIASDPRHTEIVVVDQGKRGKRHFEGWHMAMAGSSAHYVAQIVERVLQTRPSRPDASIEKLRRLMAEFADQSRATGTARWFLGNGISRPEA